METKLKYNISLGKSTYQEVLEKLNSRGFLVHPKRLGRKRIYKDIYAPEHQDGRIVYINDTLIMHFTLGILKGIFKKCKCGIWKSYKRLPNGNYMCRKCYEKKYKKEMGYYKRTKNISCKERPCLMCGEQFKSTGNGHRRCGRCETSIQKLDIFDKTKYKSHESGKGFLTNITLKENI